MTNSDKFKQVFGLYATELWAMAETEFLAWLNADAQSERKKEIIQKFHDYQVEWLTSHCDLELEPVLESWVVRFLHDTANCYMMEVEHEQTKII